MGMASSQFSESVLSTASSLTLGGTKDAATPCACTASATLMPFVIDLAVHIVIAIAGRDDILWLINYFYIASGLLS